MKEDLANRSYHGKNMPTMKHSPLVLSAAFLATLSLSACGSQAGTTIAEENQNPLVASRYGDELADSMANLVIQNDEIIKDPIARSAIDAQITFGKQLGTDARQVQAQGMKGTLIPIKMEMAGDALYVSDMLFLASDFSTKPGPELHVLLSTAVDPRDIAFPDPSVIDLGVIQSIYGAQQYRVPHQKNPMLYRTLVLFDRKLSRIYGFAQLSK